MTLFINIIILFMVLASALVLRAGEELTALWFMGAAILMQLFAVEKRIENK